MYGKREISILPSFLLSPNMVYLSCLLDCRCQCRSVTQSRLILCNPVSCSMLGFPVFCCLPEFAWTHVCWVSDAIQPAHPLLSPSPPALSLSYINIFSNEASLHIRRPKYWSFSISSSSEYSGLISFRIDWYPYCPRDSLSRLFTNTTVQKH